MTKKEDKIISMYLSTNIFKKRHSKIFCTDIKCVRCLLFTGEAPGRNGIQCIELRQEFMVKYFPEEMI